MTHAQMVKSPELIEPLSWVGIPDLQAFTMDFLSYNCGDSFKISPALQIMGGDEPMLFGAMSKLVAQQLPNS